MIQAAANDLALGAVEPPAPLVGELVDIAPPDLAKVKRMFEEARDQAATARAEALRDCEYYDGKQWTDAEKAALAARKQPDTVINRIRPAVDGIVGVIERGRADPRGFPREPGDEDAADASTDVLRYIADKNRFRRVKSLCFREELKAGTMSVIIEVGDDADVTIRQIPWQEFFADPRSLREDFGDARYMGVAKWMDADDVVALYPDKAADVRAWVDSSGGSPLTDQTFADRPMGAGPGAWTDRRRRRIFVVELYHREVSGWQRCVFHASGLLDYGPSPYHDDRGRPVCPIEAQSAYVDTDNARYGAIRDMRGPQDETNKRRSKLLHLLSVSQVEATDPSSIETSADLVRAEAARPDGVIPFGWRKVSTSDMASGQAQLLQEAKSEIERMGPNPAVLGRAGADSSGRALMARQQAGLTELAMLYGGLEDWELRVYRQCWARAKQFWKAPMFIRVTDDEDSPKFVGLNQPVQPDPSQMGNVVALPGQDVAGVLGYKNAIAEMDVDIILDTTPETANIQAEQFQDLVQLAASQPGSVPFEILLELSSTPHKRRLIDKLKKAREEEAQAKQEQLVWMQQMGKATAEAALRKTNSEASLNEAKAQSTIAGTGLDVMSAGLEHGYAAAGPSGDQVMPPV